LNSFRKISLLAETLLANPSLPPLLHGIDICPGIGRHSTCEMVTEEHIASLMFILSLDGLHSLRLGGQLTVEAERLLNAMAHPQAVARLHVDGKTRPTIGPPWSSSLRWDEVLAHKFPNLRTLHLSDVELDIIPPSDPYDLHITNIMLHNITMKARNLSHLSHGAWLHLRHLSIAMDEISTLNQQARMALDCCGASLNSLHLQARDKDIDSAAPIFDAASYPFLQRLSIGGIFMDLNTVWSISRCCDNLEELVVAGRLVYIMPDEWSSILRSQAALPRLRSLYTPWGTTYPPFARWSEFERCEVIDAATSRGISLGSFPWLVSFFEMQ